MSLTPNEKDLLAKKSDLEGILKPDANDILHLPDITISLAENQQGYTTSGLSKDGLVFAGAGTITGITSSDGNSATLAASQSAVSAKQDKLIAGSNITIAQDGKTISATDTNEIENLTDVDITNLANGQILKYNSTSQKWENGNESGGGSSTLAGLSDVDITSPSAGQGLVYDATNQEWVNGNVSTSSSIDTLTDVNLTNLSNGQILKYNSTSQEWENTNESGGSSTRHYLGQLIERVSSADSHITASTSNASYADWGAFNGTNPTNLSSPEANSCWLPVVDQTNQWIQYHFDEERYFTKIGINCFSNYGSAWVGTIKVEGSTDGTNWTNVLASGSTYQLTANLQALTAVEVDLDDTDTWTYIKVTFVEKMSIAYQPSCFINEVYVYGGELQAIPENIEDLQNVNITSPSDGQVLTYDNTSGKWVNDTPTASSSISTLTDVNLTSLSDGQILKYDATNQEWVNADESGGGGGTSSGLVELARYTGAGAGYAAGDTITLSDNINNYDVLMFASNYEAKTTGFENALVTVNDFKTKYSTTFYAVYNPAAYADVKYLTDTTISVLRTNRAFVNAVYGMKLGFGGSNNCIDTLWTGLVYPESQPETVTLFHPYDDYDYIIITSYALYSNVNFYTTDVFYDLKLNERNMGALNAEVYNCVLCIPLSSTSLQFPYYGSYGRNTHITGVYGVKLGGSSVTPNPQGTPTDTLSTIEIDGTIYDIEGSGGGGGSGDKFVTYTKSVTTNSNGWWFIEDENGNILDTNTYIIVDISIENDYKYDVLWSQYDNDGTDCYLATLFQINDGFSVRSSNTKTWTITYAKKDFSSVGGGIDYSTSEQDTGLKWIDNKPIYQKTIHYSGTITSSAIVDNLLTTSNIDYFVCTELSYIVNNSYRGSGFQIEVNITSNGITVDKNNAPGGVNSISDIYATIRYTKASS